MTDSAPNDGLQLRSLVKESGEIELSLVRVPTPKPAADEVVVRVEATPINPSDIGLLFGAADLATVAVLGGAMYSQLRTVKVELCLLLPAGTSAADGASAFVNPLTALGMCETMRR